jgi:hypothetical protein
MVAPFGILAKVIVSEAAVELASNVSYQTRIRPWASAAFTFTDGSAVMFVILVVLLFAISQLLLWRFVARDFNNLLFFHPGAANAHAGIHLDGIALVWALINAHGQVFGYR